MQGQSQIVAVQANSAGIRRAMGALHDLPPCRI